MRIIHFFALALFLPFITAEAQETEGSDPFPEFSQAISIVPQYAAISGIRFDYERKLKNGANWLLFAPQFYSDQNGYNDYDKFSGFGMNVYFKKFIAHGRNTNSNGLSRVNVYFSAGPTFQYFDLKSVEEVPEEYVENGVAYIRFNSQDVSSKIYKIGGNSDFGLQFIFDQFVLDLYAGMGIRFAMDNDGKTAESLNDYWVEPGYSGILLDGGVRFGFMLK
jgi:hypothetical protein